MVLNAERGIRELRQANRGFAHEAGKGIVIVVNKWDTLEKDNHTMKTGKQIFVTSSVPILCANYLVSADQQRLISCRI